MDTEINEVESLLDYAGRLSLILKIVNRILSAEAPIFGNLVL